MSVVILAAGLGTRMKSRQAKVLHRAGGRTLVEHVVRSAMAIAPPERIFVVVGHQGDKVRAALAHLGIGGFIEQTEQKGTGHAVKVGREQLCGLPGYLVVLYGDCPLISAATLGRLVAMQAEGALADANLAATILTAIMDDPTGYGRVLRDSAGNPTGVVEQKAGTPEQLALKEANMGLYCYDNATFWKHVDEIEPNNPVKEYYLTDMVEILNRAGHRLQTMVIDDASEVIGINNRVELAQVDRLLRDRKTRQLMVDGATLEKPETITADPDVTVGMDSVVGPFVQLLGSTHVGENCRIGAGSILEDALIGDGVEIQPYSLISGSTVGDAAHVGPFCRLRMGAVLAPGAHVGNFVELKKTQFGAGSKAMHLAYLGDSQIGENVNIGAGAITCNYDGAKKHPTIIDDGVFVGSNSTLVAPLHIGAGAYTAAGSVITETVPADALGVGRSRQVVKEGWAKRRRDRQKKQ